MNNYEGWVSTCIGLRAAREELEWNSLRVEGSVGGRMERHGVCMGVSCDCD